MQSHLTRLECTYCGAEYSADEPQRVCPDADCGKVLYPRYDLDAAASALDRDALRDRPANMWRYFEVMPVRDPANVITLGEGFTPIFQAERLGADMGVSNLLIKDEGVNPTASFKARGLSAAVSKAKELGITKITMPSAGNAAGAMTSYAAKGGIEAYVFMPKDAPEANRIEVEMTGGELTLIDGLISDAGVLSRERAAREGLFDVSTLQEPYRVEGKKTMGYEIAEQLGWTLPDAIIYPTGGRHGHRRNVEGVRRNGSDGLDRLRAPPNVRRAVRGLRPHGPRLRARGRVRRALGERPDNGRRHPSPIRHRRLPDTRRHPRKRRRRPNRKRRRDTRHI